MAQYESEAQRRWADTPKGARTKLQVADWDKLSKGKKLAARKKKK